jgi:hypothetical protein
MSDDYLAKIRRLLSSYGISDYQVVRRRRHRAVVVAHGGKTVTVTVSSTGSDFRGARNAAADLRRALGLAGKEAASK